MKRAFADSLCRVRDLEWLEGCIDALGSKVRGVCVCVCVKFVTIIVTASLLQQHLPSPGGSVAPPLTLSGIPLQLDQKGEKQRKTSACPLSPLPEVRLQPLSQWGDLHLSVANYLMRYREENGVLQLELSDSNLRYLVKLQRALKFPR